MGNDLSALSQRLMRIRPWAAIAMTLAIALSSYYLLLGYRYWQAAGQTPELSGRVQNLVRSIRSVGPSETDLEAELVRHTEVLEGLEGMFVYDETDALLAIISKATRDSGIVLMAAGVEEATNFTLDGVVYSSNPFTLTVTGNMKDIFSFMSMLHQRVPVVEYTGMKTADLDTTPTAQIRLRFVTSPDEGFFLIEQDEGKPKPAVEAEEE